MAHQLFANPVTFANLKSLDIYYSKVPNINFRQVFPKLEKLKIKEFTEKLEGEYPSLKKLIVNDCLTREYIEKLVKGKKPGFYLKGWSELTKEEKIIIARNNRNAIIDV